MPKFTTSEDGVINDLTKKAGLNEDTLKRRNCVKREFEVPKMLMKLFAVIDISKGSLYGPCSGINSGNVLFGLRLVNIRLYRQKP